VDRAATISYVESWPKRNAKKKEIKIAIGDYVMLHQPQFTCRELPRS
jgi:hypothetical protein